MSANSSTATRMIIVCTALCLVGACAGGGGGGGTIIRPAGSASLGSNPLSYVAWGPWSANGNVGAAPSGTLTPPSAMPKTGVAQYSGGVYATNGAAGSTNISVDFGAASVSMGIDFPKYNVAANGTGSVTGNKFNVQGKQSASLDVPIVPYSYDFAASGAFYGPSASETAGTFSLSTESPFGPKNSFEGTFGASK